MKTFCLGDIHGEADALNECLELCEFNNEEDTLVSLGDVVDRGPDSYRVVETLLSLKHTIFIQGNHDECWFKALKSGEYDKALLWRQGAQETYKSYVNANVNPEVHFDFFKNQFKYGYDGEVMYVHGGFNRHYFISEQADESVFTWDRDLWAQALSFAAMKSNTFKFKYKDSIKKVFIGHTPTMLWGKTTPMKAANIWNLDTGAGKGGPLTIMNVDTEEYWQSNKTTKYDNKN